MKQKTKRSHYLRRLFTIGLIAAMTLSLLAGCGGKGKDGQGNAGNGGNDSDNGDVGMSDEYAGKDANFTWWIYTTDGDGQYYDDYDDSPVAQWVQAQYWNVKEGGIGTEENGRKLDFSYLVPIAGSENDNFNTMMSTDSYPEIIDLAASTESPQALHENGQILDLTEYVEKYMPNYLAYLDANPELKPFVQVKEDDGSVHYYALYSLREGSDLPWQGTCYRRDWVAKYAEPTDYVWDWDSDYVKENGHPQVTPLAKAKEGNELEGWKKNEVTSFTADYDADNDLGYEDNVIFPSGKENPLTISDWEWMFEAFEKAIEARGWENDSSSYCTSVYYQGFMQTGDLVSSFGGGTGQYYVKDGEASFDGDSENFRTYLECLNNWYEKGWLDGEFNTRATDMFFSINSAGVAQGKVGLWDGSISMVGTSIRTTCQNEEDASDAFVMGAALPINDVYGGEAQMYKEPDALYQGSRIGGKTAVTPKAEDKDLAVLFTFFDWTYTMEGGLVLRSGLNEEQYASVELNPDILAERGLKASYTSPIGEDGRTVYKRTVDLSDTIANALIGQRMDVGLNPMDSDEFVVDPGAAPVNNMAYDLWKTYSNIGNVLDYQSLLNVEESDAYSKISTAVTDYQRQYVPGVIKGTMSWEEYVSGLETLNPDEAAEYLQKYVDLARQ